MDEEIKYSKSKTTSAETGAGGIIKQKKESSLEVRLGQIDARVSSHGEKIDGAVQLVTNQATNTTSTLRWGIGTVLVIVSIVGVLINNQFSTYNSLQREYYQLLIQNKDDINKFILNSEIKNTCTKSNSYWEFKTCLSSLK